MKLRSFSANILAFFLTLGTASAAPPTTTPSSQSLKPVSVTAISTAASGPVCQDLYSDLTIYRARLLARINDLTSIITAHQQPGYLQNIRARCRTVAHSAQEARTLQSDEDACYNREVARQQADFTGRMTAYHQESATLRTKLNTLNSHCPTYRRDHHDTFDPEGMPWAPF